MAWHKTELLLAPQIWLFTYTRMSQNYLLLISYSTAICQHQQFSYLLKNDTHISWQLNLKLWNSEKVHLPYNSYKQSFLDQHLFFLSLLNLIRTKFWSILKGELCSRHMILCMSSSVHLVACENSFRARVRSGKSLSHLKLMIWNTIMWVTGLGTLLYFLYQWYGKGCCGLQSQKAF